MKLEVLMLRTAAVLWLVWGLVHVAAGIMTLAAETVAKVQGIADGVDPATLAVVYPDAVGAILNQHGFNLLWFGIVAIVGAWFIWRQNVTAVFVTAVVGGLADIGYFVFVDLGGYNNFVPGTVMTIVSASAIVLSVYAWSRLRGERAA